MTDCVGKIAGGLRRNFARKRLIGAARRQLGFADQTLAIARWWSCESAETAERALHELASQLFGLEDRVPLVRNTASLIMFDAAHRGAEPGQYRSAMIPRGAVQ